MYLKLAESFVSPLEGTGKLTPISSLPSVSQAVAPLLPPNSVTPPLLPNSSADVNALRGVMR